MRSVRTLSGDIAVHVLGSGPTLVLLHANPGSSRDYDSVIGSLARRYRVLAVDWPGYGESAPPPLQSFVGAISYVEVLSGLLDALSEDEPTSRFLLVGNSVGGYAALRAAAAHPERIAGLVLIAPGGFTAMNPLTRAFCSLLGTPRIGGRLSGALARLYLRRRNSVTRRAIAEAAALRSIPARLAVHGSIWRSFALSDHDLRHAPPPPVPLLLQWGRWDPILPALSDGRRAARTLQAELQTFATGHEPYAEAPHDWLAAVKPFLESLRDGNDWVARAPANRAPLEMGGSADGATG